MRWILTPGEFAHVWTSETGLDFRPYPVNAAIPVDPAPGLRQQYARNTDADLAAALLLCARTDTTTLTVSGERSVPGAAPERILACAAVTLTHAAILIARGESIVVMLCPAQAIGDHLVEVIGSAPAGRTEAMREAQQAVLVSGRHPIPAGPARFQRALRAPVDSRGIVTVTAAPHNSAPPPTRHRTWLDVAGDGRYLLTTADQLTLTPVDDDAFAAQIRQLAGLH